MSIFQRKTTVLLLITLGLLSASTRAAVIQFSNSDFGLMPIFSNVQNFSFTVNIEGNLAPGTTYVNPDLNSIVYNVSGSLASTPSMFPGFNLNRSIVGNDFYLQGSSFSFEIAASADLADGLQASELVADAEGRIFYFNAREFEQFPPRYHPSLFELFDDGTGRIQNSNNKGLPDQFNPDSGLAVDVDFGEEYITDLTFTSASYTLAGPQVVVPLPPAFILFACALVAMVGLRQGRLHADKS